jgi:hypothetical protein
MHADDVVAVFNSISGAADIRIPQKLPFGLRSGRCSEYHVCVNEFMNWLQKRVDNLQRSYMNKVYIARKVGREFENIIRDSCAMSITDQFWVNRSDIDMSWAKLQEMRDNNEVLNDVALSGDTANLDWEAAMQGATSLFATKGAFPKAVYKRHMLKCGGTQEREWVATIIGEALGLSVQKANIINPSVGGSRREDGSWIYKQLKDDDGNFLVDKDGNKLMARNELDDTLVRIDLFTSDTVSLVHASEIFMVTQDYGRYEEARRIGQHHRRFYDWLRNDEHKRQFERVLILNWLISNHDMHGENFGCLYCPETFELVGIAPSFDHNSADFDGTIPELDVPDIITPAINYHGDVIAKIESGELETVLGQTKKWLTSEQKDGVKAVGAELVQLYKRAQS